MEQVIIGVDPHKLSATIEVVDHHERKLGEGRFRTDKAGYAAMLAYVKAWPERVWAVEGANGVGRSLAQRLLETGEVVVDVPAKLAARVRLFDTGHNRKTDAHDAHSIAAVAVRTKTLRVLRVDGEQALRLLVDRYDALSRRRVQTGNRLQAHHASASVRCRALRGRGRAQRAAGPTAWRHPSFPSPIRWYGVTCARVVHRRSCRRLARATAAPNLAPEFRASISCGTPAPAPKCEPSRPG
jgi:Transposase